MPDDSDSDLGFDIDYGDHHDDDDDSDTDSYVESVHTHVSETPSSPHYEIRIYMRSSNESSGFDAIRETLNIALSDLNDIVVATGTPSTYASTHEHEMSSDSEEIAATPPNEHRSRSRLIEVLETPEGQSDDEHSVEMDVVSSDDESSFSTDIDITRFFVSDSEILDISDRPESVTSDISPNSTLGSPNSELAESEAPEASSDMEVSRNSEIHREASDSDMDIFEVVELVSDNESLVLDRSDIELSGQSNSSDIELFQVTAEYEDHEDSDYSESRLYRHLQHRESDTFGSFDMQLSQSSGASESVLSDNLDDDLILSSGAQIPSRSEIDLLDLSDDSIFDSASNTSDMHHSQHSHGIESVQSDDDIFELPLASSSDSLDMESLEASEIFESDFDDREESFSQSEPELDNSERYSLIYSGDDITSDLDYDY